MENPTDRMPKVSARSRKPKSSKKKQKSPCTSIRRMKGESDAVFMKRKKKTCKEMSSGLTASRLKKKQKKEENMPVIAPASVSTSTTNIVAPPAMRPAGISYNTTRHHRVPQIDVSPIQKIGSAGQEWTINYPEIQPYQEGGGPMGGFSTDPHQVPSNIEVDRSNALANSYGVLGEQGVTPQYQDHSSSHEFLKSLHHEIIDRPYGAPAVLKPQVGPSLSSGLTASRLKPIPMSAEEKARIPQQDIDISFSSTDTTGGIGFPTADIFKPSVPFMTAFGSTISM